MLGEVLAHLHNWFVREIMHDTYTIENGGITLPIMQNGQYFRIIGSVFNDGVYQYPASGLVNETFTGAIWALAVPPAVIALSDEIKTWQEKNGAAALSPYQSESFGGYSYSKATDSTTGGAPTWQTAFRGRLNQWRKMR